MHSLCSVLSLLSLSLSENTFAVVRNDLVRVLAVAASHIEQVKLDVKIDDWNAALQHIARMCSLRELTVKTRLTNEQLLSLTHAPALHTVSMYGTDLPRTVDIEALRKGVEGYNDKSNNTVIMAYDREV